MLSGIKLIQDFAGENSPVAPFAKSMPKDKYAILNYTYDEKGELWGITYEDYVAYKGEKIDFSEHLYLKSGAYGRNQYMYGKAGNLWKIHDSYCRDGEWRYYDQKIGRKFQKTEDVYEKGYLKERRFIREKQKQSFCYSINYLKLGGIHFEWQDEKNDVVVRIIERYENVNGLTSQYNFEAKLSNPADIRTDELLFFHYDEQTNIVTQMDRISNDNVCTHITKTLFSNFDEKGNWLQTSFYRYNNLGGEEKQTYSERREIAYDEAAAYELKAKFESLVAEFYAATDESRQADLMDQLITALDLEEDK